MKAGESDSFTIQLFFLWYVRIRREPENLAPFKYALEACCLDNVQTFSRRYITLEKALLHCLNGFNENAVIPNRYQSLQNYFADIHMANANPRQRIVLQYKSPIL